jgi:hypothetical protein
MGLNATCYAAFCDADKRPRFIGLFSDYDEALNTAHLVSNTISMVLQVDVAVHQSAADYVAHREASHCLPPLDGLDLFMGQGDIDRQQKQILERLDSLVALQPTALPNLSEMVTWRDTENG